MQTTTKTPDRQVSLRHRALAALCGAACLTGAAAVAAPSTASAAPTRLHIVPGGSGSQDGSSWADAGELTDLDKLIRKLPDGGEVWVRADAGAYELDETVQVRNGGSAGSQVVVRGVDRDGTAATARLVGNRTSPYRDGGRLGPEGFKLRNGASHLAFRGFSFTDVGYAFIVSGGSTDIDVSDMQADNVRRFFDNRRAPDDGGGTISDITIKRVSVAGFSRSAVRLQYASHDVLVEDVVGDSERQDGDDFAMGVHLEGTVHDVVLRRVTMRNSLDTLHSYWNGDGFASERGVSDVRFEDTLATGSTDAGYDLKSSNTVLDRARASGNKRNIRLWGTGVVVRDCTLLDPRWQGGRGSQAQVWLASSAEVRMTGCRIEDGDADTTVFELEDGADLDVADTSVTYDTAATLRRVESGASLDFDDVVTDEE